MLERPRKTLNKIKSLLKRQQKQVEEQLKLIEKNDPVNVANEEAGSSEPGTDSWMAEAHNRLTATKNNLQDLLYKTKLSLLHLRKGTYGRCENCGKQIEIERLEALPTAILCVACSKKSIKKNNKIK